MAGELPPELSALLDGKDPASRDEAWSAFLERHSRLLLKTARTFGRDYDASMDRYRFIVEALRNDDFRRLRSYQVNGRSSFRSWRSSSIAPFLVWTVARLRIRSTLPSACRNLKST